MARLPGMTHLIQQIDGVVVLFQEGSEREVVRFDPTDQDATAKAQGTIHFSVELSDEDKSMAHFWCGYFYAHAGGAEALVDVDLVVDLMEALADGMSSHRVVLSGPSWGAYDKLRRQMLRD